MNNEAKSKGHYGGGKKTRNVAKKTSKKTSKK